MSAKKCNKCKKKYVEADIIVVGMGAAGCVLANRLSKNGHFSTIAIEAGANNMNDPEIQAVGLPALLLPSTAPQKYFWAGWRQSVPMVGLNGRSSDWTTGMLIGGGSAINGLYFGRGSNSVYSQWESISQSVNWNLTNILNTFKKLENYNGLTMTTGTRGTNGPVNILQTPTVSQITTNVLLPASQAAFPSIPVVLDYNDSTVQNCIDTRSQWFVDPNGKRVSSATAFLNDSVMTHNGKGKNGHTLNVLFNSVVEKILFDKHGRAKGILYLKDGKRKKIRARKAVILSAGINSSKILELSGVGSFNVLKNANIKPVFINENIGKSLQNHPLIFISLLANPNDNGVPIGAPYAFTINNVYLPVVGGAANDPRALQILFEYIPAGVAQSPTPLIAIGFELLNPISKGSVHIQSNNPYQICAADDGFYQDPTDLENMKNCIKVYIRALLEQLALIDPPYYRPIIIDPINSVILSNYNDKVVEEYVKNNSNLSLDVHHFTSHCKMAELNNGGVVDGNTLVYGTKNVYVADNSICPVIPDINTTASAIMIGLRCSEILEKILREK